VSTGSRANPTGSADDAAATYKAKCASCHGADGSGSTAAGKALKVRDLRSADVQKQSDDQLYAIIAKGKEKMPGYEKPLGAETCKALVAHIRNLAGK
jgi:cytochrome c6